MIIGPRYVPVLSGFFSERMVFSGVSASFSLLKLFSQPSLHAKMGVYTRHPSGPGLYSFL